MSREFNIAHLSKRKTYHGFSYRARAPVSMTGGEWRAELDLMRCSREPDDPDCVHAHEGREFVYEVYL